MSDLLARVLSLEGVAVFAAIAYLVLAARENLWCWFFALLSSGLYTWIFWDVSLLMESALNVYYVVMAVVGWWEWRYGGRRHTGMRIHTLRWWQHVALVTLVLVLAFASGWLLERYTSAALPFLDAFTTWGAVVTTMLVVRKVLENWIYWLVVDGVSIYLYVDRGLYLTALLFVAYLGIVTWGLVHWWREYSRMARDPAGSGTSATVSGAAS